MWFWDNGEEGIEKQDLLLLSKERPLQKALQAWTRVTEEEASHIGNVALAHNILMVFMVEDTS